MYHHMFLFLMPFNPNIFAILRIPIIVLYLQYRLGFVFFVFSIDLLLIELITLCHSFLR